MVTHAAQGFTEPGIAMPGSFVGGDPWFAGGADSHASPPAAKTGDAALLSALSMVSRLIREDVPSESSPATVTEPV